MTSSKMRLVLDNLQAKDLTDTGSFMDKQDPALRIIIGTKEVITQRQQDAGTNAAFPEVFEFEVDTAQYNSGLEIAVEMLNVSKSGSKTHIGTGKAVLKTLVPAVGSPVTITIDLVHKKKGVQKQQGKVVMRGRLEAMADPALLVSQPAPATAAPVSAPATKSEGVSPKSSEPTKTVVEKADPVSHAQSPAVVEAEKPKATAAAQSTTASTDKQNPKQQQVPEAAKPEPQAKPPSSSSAPAPRDLPHKMKLVLDNLQAKELVDTGSFMDGQDPALRVTIGGKEVITQRQQDAGTNATFPESFEFDVDAAQYQSGLEVAVEVLNVSKSGSKTHIGAGKAVLSTVVPDVGPFASFIIDLTHKKKGIEKQQGKVIMRAKLQPAQDSAKTTEKLASAPVSSAEKQTPAAATAPAAATENRSSKPTAEAIKPTAEAIKPTALPDNSKILLLVTRIATKNLTNVEMMPGDKNDPYCVLEYFTAPSGTTKPMFAVKTAVQNSAGDAAVWDFPPNDSKMQFEVSATELRTGLFRVTVSDENKMLAHTVIGKGELTAEDVAKLSSAPMGPIELTLPLVDKAQWPAGSVTLTVVKSTDGSPATIAASAEAPVVKPAASNTKESAQESTAVPPPAATTKPPSTANKPAKMKLVLDNLQAKELVDTGSFMDGQDPALRVTIGGKEVITQRQQDAGTNATFPESFEFDVDAAQYQSGLEVAVEVLNVSKSGSKTHIGLGKAILSAAVPDVGSPASFIIDLIHKKKGVEKQQGKVIMRGRLEASTEGSTKKESDPKVDNVDKQPSAPTTVDNKKSTAPLQDSNTSAASSTAGDSPILLRVTRVSAKNLKSVEMMMGDKNDPYCIIEYFTQPNAKPKFTFTTAVQDGAGSAAMWDYPLNDPKMQFEVSAAELRTGLFRVTAKDENKMLSHALIGSGELTNDDITRLSTAPVGPVELTVALSDAKKKPAGTVTLTVDKSIVPPPSAVPDEAATAESTAKKAVPAATAAPGEAKTQSPTAPFQTGKLLIKRIDCQDLPNVESLGGANDPYVVVQLGPETRQTECIEEGGANVSFPFLDICVDVERDTVEFEPLRVQVFDKNKLSSHVLIGGASQSIESLLSQDCSVEPAQIIMQLVDKKNKPRGKAILFVQLVPAVVLNATQKEQPLSTELTDGGVLLIHRVRAFDLKNTAGTFSSAVNNPIVKLSLDEFKHTTPPLDLSKGSGLVLFDHLDLEIPLTKEKLLSGILTVEIQDQGTISNSNIGKGTVAVKPVGYQTGTEVELQLIITDKKGTTTGRVVVYCSTQKASIKLAPNPVDVKIQEGFERGFFRVKSITGHDLKNTEWFGKQDPYIQLQFGTAWKERTMTLDNQGKECHWDNLDFKCDVTRAELESNAELTLTAFDENDATADALIGSGSVVIKPAAVVIGQDTRLTLDIYDKKKKLSGNLVIILAVHNAPPPPENIKLPDGFTMGCFRVRKITSHGLVTGNFISAPAPSIQLKHGGAAVWSTRTSVGEGHDPIWDFLDIRSPTLTVESFTSQPLTVELFDGKSLAARGVVDNLAFPTSMLGTELEVDVKLFSAKKSAKLVAAGRVTLFLTVTEPEPEKKEEIKAPERKPAFTEGVLLITSIKAYELKNVELMGKSDPFVALSYGPNWSVETKPLPDAGGEVIYNNLEFYTNITAEQLITKELSVTVWDKNNVMSNAVIGTAKVSLKRMAYSIGKEIELAVNIVDKKNKPAGKLVIRAEIRERGVELFSKALPAGFVKGIVHITKIRTFDLKNTEWLGKQDPFVVIKLNGTIVDKTATKNNAGGDVLFDLLDIKADVTAAELQTQSLTVEVYDDNTTGHTLIGAGTTTMTELYALNKEVELSVPLKNKRGNVTGRVLLFAQLEEPPVADTDVSKIKVAEDFVSGCVHIQKIAAFKLYNTELFTKQDPYVTITLNDWSGATPVQNNAGDNCLWDLLDLSAPVDKTICENGVFNVVVKNKNLLGDAIIGTGSAPVRRTCAKLNTLYELTVNLINPKTKKSAGKVILHTELRNVDPAEDDENLRLAENFEFGTFRVSKIKAFGLKNTELFGGLQDPFVTLKLGDVWSTKTHTKEDAGNNAEWDYLNLECDVYPDMVLNTPLEVTVFDENQLKSHALIGSGTVSLLKCGSKLDTECELTVQLVDENQKATGKVVIFAMIAAPEPDKPLPDTFEQGELRIKRVSAFGLKNSEFFGMSKGDPFMILKLNDFSATTLPLPNAGVNPSWTHLDYVTKVTARNVKADELTVECWDQNTMSAHKKVGTCQLPLCRAGSKVENEVEVSGGLKDDKGKDVGRVVVLMQLNAVSAYKKAELSLPADFVSGVIVVSRIQARGLQNKELMGKQDPYVRVTVGDWSETTTTLDNAGSNATWSNLDMQAEVNAAILSSEQIKVEVFDENTTRGDVVLGSGFASVRKLCSRIDNTVDLTVDLSDSTGAKKGEVTLTAVLQRVAPDDASDGLPDSAVKVYNGVLCIKQITGFDLKGGDSGPAILGGKPDPYIMFECAGWKSNTQTLNNAGRNPVWSDITDIEAPVTGDVLRYKRLNVTVMDKNSLTVDSWMSRGDMSLKKVGSQAGNEVTHIIRLKDKRGKSAGKLEIVSVVKPVELPAASGKDGAADSDILSGAATKGTLKLRQCEVSQLRNTATLSKQDLYLVINIARFKKTTGVNKGAGVASTFIIQEGTEPMATAQLVRQGAKVTIMAKGGALSKDSVVGEANIALQNAILQPNTWVDLKSDVSYETKFAGKCCLSAMFVPDGAEFGDFHRGDESMAASQAASLAASQAAAVKAQEELEARLRAQLERERKEMMATMAAQNAALQKSLEGLADALSKEKAKKVVKKKSPLEGVVIHEINELKLPTDVKQWRSAHVQAWVAFQMELPQYMESFQRASVDGLVLIKHISYETLTNSLDITDSLHCSKILEGIKVLQAKQKKVDEEAEKERLRRLQLQAEDDARKRKLLADMQKAEKKPIVEKKAVKKKKKKVPNATAPPQTFFGEVREQGVIDRARIERDMKTYRQDKAARQAAADGKNNTWNFEYTGAPQPKADSSGLYDVDPFSRTLGSKSYQNAMALDVLTDKNFTGGLSKTNDGKPKAPQFTKVRPIPSTCSTEEVLAVIKGAMYDLSSWLIEVERINFQRQAGLDSDLLDMRDERLRSLVTRRFDYTSGSTGAGVGAGGVGEIADFAESLERQQADARESLRRDLGESFDHNDDDHDHGRGHEDDDDDQFSLPPPDYEEVLEGAIEVVATSPKRSSVRSLLNHSSSFAAIAEGSNGDEEHEGESLPPPAYDELSAWLDEGNTNTTTNNTTCRSGQMKSQPPPPPPTSKIADLIAAEISSRQEPVFDRMTLIFNALVGQQNNNAKWLGVNGKLTRIKLSGGMESLLRLQCNWSQFDTLWTKLDYKRSGDIDLNEFKAFFGDLSEFEFREGAQSLSTKGSSKAVNALMKCIYELCDALRHAGFTVVEMFSGFDRNGSGDISLSEFCSMLRLVVGNNFDKRLIYQALAVLDTDGNKSISLSELLAFVYRVWKSQLDDLAEKLATLDERMTGDSELILRIIEERKVLKEAVKKNFPRQWRDKLEREGGALGHNIPGPFQALLRRMEIGSGNELAPGETQKITNYDDTRHEQTVTTSCCNDRVFNSSEGNPIFDRTAADELNLGSPIRSSYRPSETTFGSPLHGKIPPGSIRPSSRGGTNNKSLRFSSTQSANTAGHNQIMRFKIKVPSGEAPTRSGALLVAPPVKNLNKDLRVQSQETGHILSQNDTLFGGF